MKRHGWNWKSTLLNTWEHIVQNLFIKTVYLKCIDKVYSNFRCTEYEGAGTGPREELDEGVEGLFLLRLRHPQQAGQETVPLVHFVAWSTGDMVIIDRSQLTSVPERHQHHQGDHNVEGEGAGHLDICPPEPPLVLGDSVVTFIPVLVWGGQAQVQYHVKALFHKIIPSTRF